MRLPLLAATIVVLSLIACSGSATSTPDTGPENTPSATPEITEPPPASASSTPETHGNTLIETPEYTGIIISEDGASEFGYLLGDASTAFWEPSIDDVARAEACIRQHLLALQQNPDLDTYRQENLAFILDNLETYRRQYVGLTVEGENRIWVNSFFSDVSFLDWERVPVDVDGGGKHYWQIEYDLATDECINLYVHGES